MVSAAISHGYVRRVAVQEDARRSGLTLTAAGRRLAEAARAARLQAFGEVVKDWPDEDVLSFAQLLTRFEAECGTLEVPENPAQPSGRSLRLSMLRLRATGAAPAL